MRGATGARHHAKGSCRARKNQVAQTTVNVDEIPFTFTKIAVEKFRAVVVFQTTPGSWRG